MRLEPGKHTFGDCRVSDAGEGEKPKGMMHFRKASAYSPRLPREAAARQGDITQLAFALLGGRDNAIAFLNTANDELGGRPLDLAMASAEGYAEVEQAIRKAAS